MAQYKIGLKFVRHSRKHKAVETITDIHTTTNLKGKVVKVRYVTEYEFCGQVVTDKDVLATTIARSL